MIDWTAYPHFSEAEMRCKCGCGRADMAPDFLRLLEGLRAAYGRPLPVTSGYRCPDHDAAVGGAGVHPTGQAADIAVSGAGVHELLGIAIQHMRGIGLKQHGDHADRFVHLDTTHGPIRPRIWTYS